LTQASAGWTGWLEATAAATAMRQSLWLYPIVEILHIIGFVVLVGSAAMFDLRLLGFSRQLPVTGMERHLLPWAAETGRVVIAYSPLGQGLLSARYSVDRRPSGGVRRANAFFTPENLRRAEPLLEALREVAGDVGATPAQVALAWVIRRPNVVAIPGASSVAQLEANAAAAELELSAGQDARLSEAAERFAPRRGLGAQAERIAGLFQGSRGGAARQ